LTHFEFNVLAPYNYDMTSNGSDIFYRTTSNKNILRLVNRDIALILGKKTGTPSSFNAKSAIIITFDNVREFLSFNMFKFQTIITTDYKKTFAIIDYERLDAKGSGFYMECSHKKHFTNWSSYMELVTESNIGY